jgi:hypothetical protein
MVATGLDILRAALRDVEVMEREVGQICAARTLQQRVFDGWYAVLLQSDPRTVTSLRELREGRREVMRKAMDGRSRAQLKRVAVQVVANVAEQAATARTDRLNLLMEARPLAALWRLAAGWWTWITAWRARTGNAGVATVGVRTVARMLVGRDTGVDLELTFTRDRATLQRRSDECMRRWQVLGGWAAVHEHAQAQRQDPTTPIRFASEFSHLLHLCYSPGLNVCLMCVCAL